MAQNRELTVKTLEVIARNTELIAKSEEVLARNRELRAKIAAGKSPIKD
jgi:hypothetical protein